MNEDTLSSLEAPGKALCETPECVMVSGNAIIRNGEHLLLPQQMVCLDRSPILWSLGLDLLEGCEAHYAGDLMPSNLPGSVFVCFIAPWHAMKK
jgi:hypothetical protein